MKNVKNMISRRDFLKKAAVSTAAVAAVSCSDKASKEIAGGGALRDGEMTMRKLNEDTVSLLGYGCMRWPTVKADDGIDDIIDQEAVNALVDYAIEHGVNYFDTAPFYVQALSEKATGIALSRHPRESYFLATKLSNHRVEKTLERGIEMYRQSLENLQTDYFDYYLLHNIGIGIDVFKERFINNGLLQFLDDERRAGHIRHLGFSIHCDVETFDYMMSLHKQWHWDFVQIQMNYIDWNNAKQAGSETPNGSYLYAELEKRGIPVVIMEPLLGGTLANLTDGLNDRLKQRSPQESVASWAFRFVGSFPGVMTVLSGMTYMEHLQDNLRTFSPLRPLTDDEMAMLEDVASTYLNFPVIPCTGCGYCMPCPYGLDIPGTFAFYNKCVNEDNIDEDAGSPEYRKARRAFLIGYDRSIPKERQADHCIGCETCVSACPQGIEIPKKMARIDRYVEKLKKNC